MADQAPGINPYRFGFNNPISLNDPTGLYEGSFADYIMDLFNRLPDDGIFYYAGDNMEELIIDFNTDGDFEYLKDGGTGWGLNSAYGLIGALRGYSDVKKKNPNSSLPDKIDGLMLKLYDKHHLQLPHLYFKWDTQSEVGVIKLFSLTQVYALRFGSNGLFEEQFLSFNLLTDNFKDIGLDVGCFTKLNGFTRLYDSWGVKDAFAEGLGENFQDFWKAYKNGDGKFYTNDFLNTTLQSRNGRYSDITFRVRMNVPNKNSLLIIHLYY